MITCLDEVELRPMLVVIGDNVFLCHIDFGSDFLMQDFVSGKSAADVAFEVLN